MPELRRGVRRGRAARAAAPEAQPLGFTTSSSSEEGRGRGRGRRGRGRGRGRGGGRGGRGRGGGGGGAEAVPDNIQIDLNNNQNQIQNRVIRIPVARAEPLVTPLPIAPQQQPIMIVSGGNSPNINPVNEEDGNTPPVPEKV